jgi:adenylate kinase
MSERIGVIFLGPPGSGKGTQAERLAAALRVPHISTGEILRTAIAKQTALGQQAKAYVENGELVPDSLLLDLVRERLQEEDTQAGWILDGFPRTVAQASFLDKFLRDFSETNQYVVNLEVADTVLIERLRHRGRQDDTVETIRRRLEVYGEQTAPVLDYYRQQGALHSIDGDQLLEEVTDSLTAIVRPDNRFHEES